MKLIQSKATSKDIDELNHIKANKVDTESLLESITVVHK